MRDKHDDTFVPKSDRPLLIPRSFRFRSGQLEALKNVAERYEVTQSQAIGIILSAGFTALSDYGSPAHVAAMSALTRARLKRSKK